MTQDSNSTDVELTDGQTSPETDPSETRNNIPHQSPVTEPEHTDTPTDQYTTESRIESARNILTTIRTQVTQQFKQLSEKLPVNPEIAALIFVTYIGALAAITYFISFYNAFGVLSLTTGVIMLTILYHPSGNVTPETTIQRYVYPGTAISFIVVGFQYILTGILFNYPTIG